MLMLLTMMLMKCPVMEHRPEQIRGGYCRAARCRRVPGTTRVQSMPPSDRTVVAADRRQHDPSWPVLLRRTGDDGRPPTRRLALDGGDLACRRGYRRPPPTTSKSTPVAASRLPLDRQRHRDPITHRLAAEYSLTRTCSPRPIRNPRRRQKRRPIPESHTVVYLSWPPTPRRSDTAFTFKHVQ